jgi:predicted anti-sigma-YlaC factor YlaD
MVTQLLVAFGVWVIFVLNTKSGPGEVLHDRYTIEASLGRGSFGKVVKCFDAVHRLGSLF